MFLGKRCGNSAQNAFFFACIDFNCDFGENKKDFAL